VTPAADDVTSLSAIGGDAHHGPAAFTTTHWSVVLEAQGESPAAQQALEKTCRTYWRALFMASSGDRVLNQRRAKDLTQGFFALIFSSAKISNPCGQEKGRLRSFLLASLKHFIANERRGCCERSNAVAAER